MELTNDAIEIVVELNRKLVEAVANLGIDGIDPSDLVVTFGPGSTPAILNDDHSAEVLVRFHVRQKSEAEKLHERADEIIKKRTRSEICITCREPIRPDQNLVSTIHGPYHGAPMTCEEGR